MFDFISKSVGKIFGTKQDRDLKKYQPLVADIHAAYDQLQSLSNDALRQKTLAFRQRITEHLAELDADMAQIRAEIAQEEDLAKKEDLFEELDRISKQRDGHLEEVLQDILPEAFAVVKEAARRFKENASLSVTATQHDRDLAANSKKGYVRIEGEQAIWQNQWEAAGNLITWDMLHYDVQLIGGMVLHDGKIAEMQTGEGKTLVATLPAYLNGLAGLGVHIVTVNDYLARRDSEWVGPIFEFLLLTVDCIDKYEPHSPGRIQAYACDITYGTNNEFGFDYLRDNMVRATEDIVQRKHHYAMVDEIDSILIDDARTPLIISGPVPKGDEQEYLALKPRVERLIEAQRKLATQFLTDGRKLFAEDKTGHNEGEAGLALLRAFRALPKYRPLIKFLAEPGVKIELQKAENYYMQEQSKHMHLADEPLLFVIDEKTNSVELTEKGAEALARGNEDPSLFVLPDITQTIMEIDARPDLDAEEKVQQKNSAVQDYSIKAERLHAISQLLKAYTLFERDQEYVVMDGQVKIVDEQTGRIMEGRRYSDGLHQALEAKENVKVGDVTQTYATVTLQNYFRMYHKLAGMTGTAETEAQEFWEIYKLDVVGVPTNKPVVRNDMDDKVYKTEREKFNAVIEEIVRLSEAGRPVLVGTTSVDVSEKLSRALQMRKINHNVLNAKQHQREAEIVAAAGQPGAVTIATNMAGRGTDIKIGEAVKKAGGLAIIGTERHESRRVDRQLRGRAGRQGDPGSSQFYVSLDDKLMRLFRSERIAKLMDRMGHEEGQVIQHSMVSKSIERAQKRVEENNFGMRKRLLEYDDVMNIQREAIYKRRHNALFGERLTVDLRNMFLTLGEDLISTHRGVSEHGHFRQEVIRQVGIDPAIDAQAYGSASAASLVSQLQAQLWDVYSQKRELIRRELLPLIEGVKAREGNRFRRVAIPYTDGSGMGFNISVDIDTAIESQGRSIVADIEKAVALALIDNAWKEHLREMDELKDSVQSASFEQKDPLVVYKMEAYEHFERLIKRINQDVASFLVRGRLVLEQQPREAREQKVDTSKIHTNKEHDAEAEQARAAAQSAGREAAPKPVTVRRTGEKIGRNDPCPCGSGKKYKHCHGK